MFVYKRLESYGVCVGILQACMNLVGDGNNVVHMPRSDESFALFGRDSQNQIGDNYSEHGKGRKQVYDMLVTGENRFQTWICSRSYRFLSHDDKKIALLMKGIQRREPVIEKRSVFVDNGYLPLLRTY